MTISKVFKTLNYCMAAVLIIFYVSLGSAVLYTGLMSAYDIIQR